MTESEPTGDELLPGQLQRLRGLLREDAVQIANYELENKLGEGGFGIVYRALQLKPVRRQVAIKVLKQGMDSEAILKRFERERQALATMHHPCIAQILDAGISENGRQFFVMEYVEGASLTSWADSKQLDTRQRLSLFTQVCEAVAHAHQKGIIHRDIKPSNVLVTESNGQPVVKIIDFGIAKAMDADPLQVTQITHGLMLVGTPEYMSPEQTRGGYWIDTRSDIYALGVLLYELLTGRLPFEHEQLQQGAIDEIYRLIRDVDPPRPSTKLSSITSVDAARIANSRKTEPKSLIRELRRELEWIPLKAMRKDPDHRYRSATEFADDIRNYLANQPLIAGPESASYRIRKFLRRYRLPVFAAAAVVLSLVTGAIGTSIMAIRAQQQSQLADARFRDVRQLANTFIFDFHESIRDLAGATPAIRQLVDTARIYLEKLEAGSNSVSGDDLWMDIAHSYVKLGDVQGRPGDNNLGDFPGALASYAKAESIFQQWQKQYPEDPRAATGMAASLLGTAGVLEYQGKLDDAMEIFKRALEIDRKVHDTVPNRGTLHRVHSTQFLIAALWHRRGNEQRALQEFQAALDLIETVPQPYSDEQWLADVAMTLGRIGTIQANLNNMDEARDSLERALAITRQLADASLDDATRHRNLALIGDQVARLYLKMNRVDESIDLLRANLEIFRRMSQADPENLRARRDVAISLTRLGDALSAQERHDDALADFQELEEITTEMFDRYPTFENGRIQANSIERIARVLIAANRLSEALPHQRRVIELREKLGQSQPKNPVILQEIAFAYVNLANLLSQFDETSEALAVTEKAITLHQQLLNETPDRDGSTRRLANSLASSAKFLVQLNRSQEALERFESAVKLRREHLLEDPANVDRKAGLAISLARCAQGMEMLSEKEHDQLPAAIAAYEESLTLFNAIDADISPEEREVFAEVQTGLQRCHLRGTGP